MSKVKVISVATMKGGAGKSTVTMLLASALAKQKGKRVAILDTDNQRTVADWMLSEQETNEGSPLVEVEELRATRVQNFLQKRANDFDVIFIDVPRVTDREKDSAAVLLLSFCDAVLIPVIGAQMDVISTIDFLSIVKQLKADAAADGFKFDFFGFINKRNRRKDNEQAEQVLQSQGLPMFDSSLPDIKLFTAPSFFSSILDYKEGQDRFGGFFTEFCNKFKIK